MGAFRVKVRVSNVQRCMNAHLKFICSNKTTTPKSTTSPSAPASWIERLFEGGGKSAERKMLMATTIGVFIAVTIGLFGLVIAGFQAWVGYQQWKHPVKED